MLNIALIGYGFLGKWHAQKIDSNPKCHLFAIIDRNKLHLKIAKEKFPNTICVQNIDEIIDQIDGGVISTPTSTHFELCELLITKNKNIFCEKPLTDKFEEGKKLEKLISDLKYSKVFQVGHSERFHPVWKDQAKRIKHFFCENSVVYFNRLAPFKNRATDVDVISDLMIHDIDLMLFLFELLPSNVSVTYGKKVTDNIDFATVIFEFSKNRKVIMNASRIDSSEVRNLIIRSSEGYLEIDLLNKKIIDSIEERKYEGADHLMIENIYFIDSIIEDQKAIVSFDDGLKAIEYVDLIRKKGSK